MNRTLAIAIAIAGFMTVSASRAQADIILIDGVDNTGTANVLLTSTNVPVAIVEGTVTELGVTYDVFFDSTSGDLLAPSSGQARVSGAPTNTFTNLFFYLAGGETFTNAVFNLNSASDGTMTILVTGINLEDGTTFTREVEVDMNGENFFTLQAINDQFMTQISLTAGAGVTFEDLRQIRLGGVGLDDEQEEPPTAVPEPTSMFLLGTGLFGLAAKVRARRKK